MRIMGLDIGDKTIGVAVSDALGITAQGVEIIRRSGDPEAEEKRLKDLAAEWEVSEVIAGLPKNMHGKVGPQGEKVMEFVERLREYLQVPVKTWDERFSTLEAERLLINADMNRKKRKNVIDKMAATIILQGYLDSKNNQAGKD